MAVTVYEARNQTLMEVYVGMDGLPFDDIKKRHAVARPRAIAHWNYRRHLIIYAEIDHHLPDEDALVFFKSYAPLVVVADYRTLKDAQGPTSR